MCGCGRFGVGHLGRFVVGVSCLRVLKMDSMVEEHFIRAGHTTRVTYSNKVCWKYNQHSLASHNYSYFASEH